MNRTVYRIVNAVIEATTTAKADLAVTNILDDIMRIWRERVDDMERASDGVTWQEEMRQIRRCITELKGETMPPRDLSEL